MENAVDAIKMAFGMMVFILAMSASMYLLNTATSTSQILLYYADETNYLDNINISEDSDITKRIVNAETIIPTLYRYYKENFAVHIYDVTGKLIQIFDVNIEGKVRKAAGTVVSKRTGEQRALISLYGIPYESSGPHVANKNPYLFEAPWIGNTSKDIKSRIDLFVHGKCAYINGTKVDYTGNNLLGTLPDGSSHKDSQFEEEFIQYAYKGDTISSDDYREASEPESEFVETITGNVKPETKIVIIYRELVN